MQANVEINTALKLVVSKFVGETNESDMDTLVETMPSLPNFDPAFAHIIDFTDVTFFNISTSFLQNLATRRPVFSPAARQIVVAPQTYIYGLSRMTQIMREPLLPNVAVVKSIEEAYSLLGISL
ncbi:MAG TPA: hypothetical protein VFB79_16295 [Candidatus Angelobacter sp.]|nr:hypothetical protein [Candidatus Angelobacter sp.]